MLRLFVDFGKILSTKFNNSLLFLPPSRFGIGIGIGIGVISSESRLNSIVFWVEQQPSSSSQWHWGFS